MFISGRAHFVQYAASKIYRDGPALTGSCPNLDPMEAVLLKCSVFVERSIGWLTSHSSFEVSDSEDASFRQSIELRARVFY